jgi:hypothetical protein
MYIMQKQPESFEAFERKAEYSLLSDFVLSTPKVSFFFQFSYLKPHKKWLSFFQQ